MKRLVCSLFLIVALGAGLWAGNEARMMRFPDVGGGIIAFVYAGDIWSVPVGGGQARRLTSHVGLELFPKISPDGRWIAFSAEYSGSRQVFVMPVEGGVPRQLTFYNDVGVLPPRGGFDYVVMDWTPDSKKIMVRANRTPWGDRMGKYFLVSPEGGLETPLQIPEAGGGRLSPDARQIVYTPIEREFRTWKRTQGGRAQDIWIYDLDKNTSRRLTDFPGTDQHPLWYKDKIYFVSDRDLTLNLYSCDANGGQVRQITHHRDYDVLWPSGRNGLVVYQNGGYIYKLDLNTGREEKVDIRLDFDNPYVLPYFKNVSDFIQGVGLAAGKKAVVEARGDLFLVPAKDGRIVNLTASQGVREMYPTCSPDGKTIAYYSDQTGEYEIYLMNADGSGTPRAVTKNSRIWRYPPKWSPDGKKLLLYDKTQTLQILDVAGGAFTVVDKAYSHDIEEFNWSPDSRWVVYVKDGPNAQDAVWVHSLEQKKSFPVTSDLYSSFTPVFSACGRYIFFASNRDYNLAFSTHEFDYLYNKATRLYAVALTKDAPKLFAPADDEIEAAKIPAAPARNGEAKGKKEEASATVKPVVIDTDGIFQRVMVFPLENDGFNALWPVGSGLLFLKNDELHLYNLAERKDDLIVKGIGGGLPSPDGKKFLYQAGKTLGIIDVQPGQKIGDGALNLADLTMKIEPLKEWRQIFDDAWRIFRDWFYVRNLHGVDWPKMKERYGQLVPFLGHRADLDFILGELVGEVNAGHTYVDWGDFPRPERIDTGLLGAELQADEKAGRYVIRKIYRGENWNEDFRSPLTEQGVAVREGDYLIRLNGQDVTLRDNPYRFLENTAGKPIPIEVNAKPTAEGARRFIIRPIKSELNLFNLDWVESRRAMVDRLSGGRIGYIYVPDTQIEGNRELFKGMYAFHNKEALIIDDRYNGGGFIPVVMQGLLARRPLNYWARRGLTMQQDPRVAHNGPKVMLINGYSSSGGDAFPYYFRKSNLGPLIGTRTWGGLIGLSGNPIFVDNGGLEVPTFGFVDTEGNWAVEGEGVAPDIEVIDLPEQVAAGRDPSVEKAVEVLLKQLPQNPPAPVTAPADPVRSQWIEKKKK